MALSQTSWKRLRHLWLDDVNYDIGVKEREDGRFTVAWVCLKCCEQGPPAPAGETLERATAFAYVGLRAHHALLHAEGAQRRLTNAGALAAAELERAGDLEEFVASHREQAAYDRVKTIFAELCDAQSTSDIDVDGNSLSDGANDSANGRREWSTIAVDLDAALNAYSCEVAQQTWPFSPRKPR